MCFDTSKSPIRNIQRMGRTGRHRPGRVVYILASGKEADDYQSNLVVRSDSTTSQAHWRKRRACRRGKLGLESWRSCGVEARH